MEGNITAMASAGHVTVDSDDPFGLSLDINISLLQEKFMTQYNPSSLHYDDGMQAAIEFLNIYLVPFIILFGICGNVLSLIVFTSTYLRLKSSSSYLALLSVSDGVFLLCVLIVWLSRVNIALFHQRYVCQIVVYLMYVMCFTSAWIVVAFTAERYILLYHPLFKDKYCTRRTALLTCGVILTLGLFAYTVTFWTHGVNYINDVAICMPVPAYYDVMTALTGTDLTLTFILPVIIIVVLNVKILLKIHQLRMAGEYIATWTDCSYGVLGGTPRRRQFYRTSISRSGSMHVTFLSKTLDSLHGYASVFGLDQGLEGVRRTFVLRRTARLLLLASTVFIVLNSPIYILRIKSFLSELLYNEPEPPKQELQLKEFFQIAYFLNYAVDFIIYSSCSGTFRAALKRLLLRFCKKDQHCNSDSA